VHLIRRQGGFTLIEVLVAIVLMGTALMAIAAAVPAGLLAVSASGFHLTALGLAQEPLDTAKRTTFANLPSVAASRASVSGFAGFEREVLVSSHSAPGDCSGTPCSATCPTVAGQPTCRTVEVRVYYRAQLGETVTSLIELFTK
jgi:prepilin-type N-terminal cleavage/methylation domain-containing protein